MKTKENHTKKQMGIFLAVAYALPFALGILMGVGYYNGMDLTVFPTAQMYYPAAGVMLAALLTRRGDPLLPRRFFTGFLATTGLMVLFAVASIAAPALPWNAVSQYVLMGASVLCFVLLLTEKKEKRAAFGLKGGQWKASVLIVLLYLVLYFGRAALAYGVGGEWQAMLDIFKTPTTWIVMGSLIISYFMAFTPFFGEEYGWRYYLQPVLQKKFGMVRGILVLGVVWGLWHLPINFFYYTSPSMGIISVTMQLVTCIALGAFYGWAYLKTDNIWLVVILHYINNNLVVVISGDYSADVLQNQQLEWGTVLFYLVVNAVLFLWVLFSKYYRDAKRRLPTMDERADRQARVVADKAMAPVPDADPGEAR